VSRHLLVIACAVAYLAEKGEIDSGFALAFVWAVVMLAALGLVLDAVREDVRRRARRRAAAEVSRLFPVERARGGALEPRPIAAPQGPEGFAFPHSYPGVGIAPLVRGVPSTADEAAAAEMDHLASLTKPPREIDP